MLRFALSICLFVPCLLPAGAVGLLLPVDAAGDEPQPVDMQIDGDRAVLSNAHLAVELSLKQGQARTVLARNLRAGKELRLDGDDFTLRFEDGCVVRSGELQVISLKHVPVGASGKRLAVTYQQVYAIQSNADAVGRLRPLGFPSGQFYGFLRRENLAHVLQLYFGHC